MGRHVIFRIGQFLEVREVKQQRRFFVLPVCLDRRDADIFLKAYLLKSRFRFVFVEEFGFTLPGKLYSVLLAVTLDNPEWFTDKIPVFKISPADHTQRRRLYPSDGKDQAAFLAGRQGEGTRGVYPYEPVRLGPQTCGDREVIVFTVVGQRSESFGDSLLRQRGHPEALDGLPHVKIPFQVVKNKLPLPCRICAADDAVASFEQIGDHPYPGGRSGVPYGLPVPVPSGGQGRKAEPFGDNRKVFLCPPSLGLIDAEFQEVPLAPGHVVPVAFEPVSAVGRRSDNGGYLTGYILLFCNTKAHDSHHF